MAFIIVAVFVVTRYLFLFYVDSIPNVRLELKSPMLHRLSQPGVP